MNLNSDFKLLKEVLNLDLCYYDVQCIYRIVLLIVWITGALFALAYGGGLIAVLLLAILIFFHYKIVFATYDKSQLKISMIIVASFIILIFFHYINYDILLSIFIAAISLQTFFLLVCFEEEIEFELFYFLKEKRKSLNNLQKSFEEVKGSFAIILTFVWMILTLIGSLVLPQVGLNLLILLTILTSINYGTLIRRRSKFESKIVVATGLSFLPVFLIFYNDYDLLLSIFLGIGSIQILSLYLHFEKEVSILLSKKWKFF